MAFRANTAFELKVTNHEFDSTANITGIAAILGTDADTGESIISPFDADDGMLCIRQAHSKNEGYPFRTWNWNTWHMMPAASSCTVSEPIYACNPHNVQELVGRDGNVYKIGHETLGVGIHGGERGTFTRIDFLPGDRQYRFGIGNVIGTLGSNGFLTLANGGWLQPAASAPQTAGAVYFKVLGTGTFTQGAYAGFGYVDVEAHAVIA